MNPQQRVANLSRRGALVRTAVISALVVLASACGSGGGQPDGAVRWRWDGKSAWEPQGEAPQCPADFNWQFPVESLDLVESSLVPGQVRSGDYKPHGGLRVKSPDTTVRAPTDGFLMRAARYTELQTLADGSKPTSGVGETQTLLEIHHPCGVLYRLDHLNTLAPEIEAELASIPVRETSQTTDLEDPVRITQGQVIATRVGFTEGPVNSFFDFGVYDARRVQPNRRTLDQLAAVLDKNETLELAAFSVCWFDFFGPETARRLRELAIANTEGEDRGDVCS